MRILLFYLSFFLLCPINQSELKAQDSEELFFQTLLGRLDTYNKRIPVEKLYVHQDRTKYLAGEIIWFKVYQSLSGNIQDGSSVVYVDLINGSNSIVTQTKWRLEYGMAAGHIELPDTLPTGNYQIRAYTRWMQNFDTEYFFTREINVSSSIIPTNNKQPVQEIRLTLFPEGGQLVTGILSRIAFEVTDANGKGIEAKGFVTDKEGNVVRSFATEHNGMGVFNFIPEEGKTYTARLINPEISVPFPKIRKQGAVMTTHCFQDQFRITLRHNMDIHQSLYLSIHQDCVIYFNTRLDTNNKTIITDIPVSQLPDGIFTITVYDETYHAWCERLFLANYPEQLMLTTTVDKETYEKRDMVMITIEATDIDGYFQSGNFSLAVVQGNLDESQERNNFYTDYFLQSELRGRIDNPAFYMDKDNSKALDLLLMTHGWRRYVWDEMAMGIQPSLDFAVEKGLGFEGKVILRNNRQNPEIVEIVGVFSQDSIREVVPVNPDLEGYFRFEDFDFTNTVEVILSANDNRGALDIEVITPHDPQFTYYSYPESVTQDENDFLLVEVFGSMPVISGDIENTIYELPEVQVTARRIRSNQSQLHDNESSLTVHEVVDNFSYFSPGIEGAMAILEYIPQMRRLQRGGRTFYQNIDVAGESTTSRGDDVKPYYILDGVRVDEKVIESTPVSSIARVELLYGPSAMIYGSGAFAGAIFFYSKDWGEINRKRPVKTIMYQFVGYNQEKEFYSPDYSLTQNYYRSDYRKTLYWQPDIVLDEDGKAAFSFFTSDDRGEYLIHCEGKSDDGMIGVSSHIFRVQ